MRLLKRLDNGDFSLTEFFDDNAPRYAILSHTWGANGDEVTFRDMIDGAGTDKTGYDKIRFCADQVARDDDGPQYFWVDTCCIDKSSSTELTEAINSMFYWYCKAAKCYVYLSDVSKSDFDDCTSSAFRGSRWFTRGWTLQELIAPAVVEFFSSDGKRLGDRISLEQQVHEITGIAVEALRGKSLAEFSVAERMSWAAKRKTTREEDRAYSLLGIFDIYMPLIYGERKNAFVRLKEEINKNLKAQHEKAPVPSSTTPFKRMIVDDPFSDLVDRDMTWDAWLRRQLDADPTYLRKAHGNLLENLFKPTSDIVDWRIQGGLIIWEKDDQLPYQDVAWNSLQGLSTPILTDFTVTLSIGHVIARPGPDLHGAGLLLKTMEDKLLGFAFSGQTNKAYMLQVSNEQVTTSRCPRPIRFQFPDPVPSAQEKDRWPVERDNLRLGCRMCVFRVGDTFVWRISEGYKQKRSEWVDITSRAPELAAGIRDVGLCFFGRGCVAFVGLEIEVA